MRLKVIGRRTFGLFSRGLAPFAMALGLATGFGRGATIPSPERLLPDDTLVVLTAPDLVKARQLWRQSPQAQLWNDPALRPFKERFLSKWNEDFVKPLERELKLNVSDYTSLLQGQLTFALTRNGWNGGTDPAPGWLLLLDARDKAPQLKSNLADIRKRWTEAGKGVRSEKIRDVEFAVLSMASNDVPKTLRKLLPKPAASQDSGDDSSPPANSAKSELWVGQVDSLLVVGNSSRTIEKIVARLTGGSLPALGDLALFQANYASQFRDAPVYAWLNLKSFLDVWLRHLAEKKDDSGAAPNPFDLQPDKIVRAAGLAGVNTVAASLRISHDGELFQLFAGVPETARQGIFKILAGEPKELTPPPFVPADVVKFQRWRIDGQKAWATLEKMLGDISPQWLSGVNFLLQTATTAGQEKDPGFDVRKNLIGNLGDDIVLFEKAPRNSAAPGQSGPALALIASPNPDQLAAALKGVLVFFGQQPGNPPDSREFLGRKVFSVSLSGMALPIGGAAPPSGPRALHYAASGGYVALSSDVSMLEEYLRNCDSQGKTLRETAGLADAMQKVTGPGASWFGFEDDTAGMRATFENLRKLGAATNSTGPAALGAGALGLSAAGRGLKDWFDFSLLPPFETIAKYFSFTVYGGSANADGVGMKLFSPAPAARKSSP